MSAEHEGFIVSDELADSISLVESEKPSLDKKYTLLIAVLRDVRNDNFVTLAGEFVSSTTSDKKHSMTMKCEAEEAFMLQSSKDIFIVEDINIKYNNSEQSLNVKGEIIEIVVYDLNNESRLCTMELTFSDNG